MPGMRSSIRFALLIPIIMVAAAIALMLWSFTGDRTSRRAAQPAGQQTTTGNAAPQPSAPGAAAPTAPRNDTASDSARGNGPLNKSR